MIEPTCSQHDAASVINLPDYHVIDAVDLPLGGRRVVVAADTIPPAPVRGRLGAGPRLVPPTRPRRRACQLPGGRGSQARLVCA